MTKKTISLIQAICQCASIVFLFIPGFFKQYVFLSKNNGSRPTTKYFQNSAFEAADISNNLMWVILLTVFLAINVAYFVLWFTTNISILRKRYTIVVTYIPLVFAVVSVVTILGYKNSYSSYTSGIYSMNYKLSWAFFVFCALYFVVLFLELFKRFSSLPENRESKTSKKTPSYDNLETLKDLLDQGIITQEEFDAKKKQLLGL